MTVTRVDEGLRLRREAVVRAHLDAEAEGDPEAILATFAHPRYEMVGTGKVYDGHDEVHRYLADRRGVFPDLRTDVIALHHSSDVVAAELWLSGSQGGRLGDVEATGRRFRCRVASFFEFRGSDLIGIRTYFDLGSVARQLA